MIPLRDSAGAPRLSPVNLGLIAVNVAVFGYELRLGAAAEGLMTRFGMTPARVAAISSSSAIASGQALLTVVTAMFLHGGVLHLAGNMLYLYIFGAAVEMRFGHTRYLWFYLAAGIASGLRLTVFIDPLLRSSGNRRQWRDRRRTGRVLRVVSARQNFDRPAILRVDRIYRSPGARLPADLVWMAALFRTPKPRISQHGRGCGVVGSYRRLPVRHRDRATARAQSAAEGARRSPRESHQSGSLV